MFDLPAEPSFSAVVPGGRVEEGETFEQTAIREVREETGLDVEVVRELGVERQPSWRVAGLRDENHFLHAACTGPTPAEWDHDVEGEVFRCYWVPLTAETRVYGRHGVYIPELLRSIPSP